MVFSSITFLFLFLPIVTLLHLLIPSIRIKNICLILASLLFYAWGEPHYVLLMLFSVVVNWLISLCIVKYPHRSKLCVIIAAIFNINLLFVFKYLGFVVELLDLIPAISIPVPAVHLPLGISFFTFQALSYVIDVKRDPANFQKNFLHVLLYIVLFPQLIAGPIVKYHRIRGQLTERRVTADHMAAGIRRFIVGLSKKLLLADRLAVLVDYVFSQGSAGELSCLGAWIGIPCYLLQIYLDFSGYSDMAIGLGKMFGFHFEENFNYPYVSSSIREFWKRWHISLSTWFREYLYIPLGGNRKGKIRTCVNLMLVFAATGIWHGANLTFFVWGIYNGVLIILERMEIIRFKHRWIGRVYTLAAVAIGFIIFRADTLYDAFHYLCVMLGISSGSIRGFLPYLSPLMVATFVFALLASTPLYPTLRRKLASCRGTALYGISAALSYPAVLFLFILCVLTLASGSYSPFIYFRF